MKAITAKVDEGKALAKVQEFEDEIDEVLKLVGPGLVVEDDEGYAKACEALLDVKVRQQVMEAEHEAFLEDVRRLLDRVNGWFKPAREKYGKAEALFKGAVRDYALRLEAKAHGLRKAAAKLGPRDEARRQAYLEEADRIGLPKVPGISFQGKLAVEVYAPEKLPAEFLMSVPDEKKIRLAVERGEDVPGVRAKDERIVKVTPKHAGKEVA